MIAFGLSRSAVARMAHSGQIGLTMAIDAKARGDFTFVIITSSPSPDAAADQQARP